VSGVAAGVGPNSNSAPQLTAAPGAARCGLPQELLLASGTPAMIWPLREGFRRLSPQARRCRFLTALPDLDDAMIRRLVDSVDGVRHIALVLTVFPPDGHEEPVAVARLVQDPADPATADIAVTVADDWQGCGVGTALVSALMQRRPAAVSRLHTAVEAGNHASLALLAAAGQVSSGPAQLGVLDVTVQLTAA
jgi:GNAT superfamily N-acetyltransferase